MLGQIEGLGEMSLWIKYPLLIVLAWVSLKVVRFLMSMVICAWIEFLEHREKRKQSELECKKVKEIMRQEAIERQRSKAI